MAEPGTPVNKNPDAMLGILADAVGDSQPTEARSILYLKALSKLGFKTFKHLKTAFTDARLKESMEIFLKMVNETAISLVDVENMNEAHEALTMPEVEVLYIGIKEHIAALAGSTATASGGSNSSGPKQRVIVVFEHEGWSPT